MSFGTNVLFYRKKFGITQEELAEKLDVTRQTVSRWETDSAFPDMEKLLALCKIFDCNMEVLVRGNAEAENTKQYKVNLDAYNKHMNMYSALITSGVCIILAGVTAMLFLYSAGVREVLGVVTLLSCIAIAVAIFISCGVAHGNFMRENPGMEKYPLERLRAFRRKEPFLYAGATVLILIGIILMVAMCYEDGYSPAGFTVEEWEYFARGIFLLLVTVAVDMYVSTGMTAAKYDVKSYNRECRMRECDESFEEELSAITEEKLKEKCSETLSKKGERISGAIRRSIMLTATALYLVFGFLKNWWHPGWIVFVVGGILCGIVSLIVEAICGKK